MSRADGSRRRSRKSCWRPWHCCPTENDSDSSVCSSFSPFPKHICLWKWPAFHIHQVRLLKTMPWLLVKEESPPATCGLPLSFESSHMKSINFMFTPDTPIVRALLSHFQTAHKLRSGFNISFDTVPDSFYDSPAPPSSHLGFIPVPSPDFIYNYVLLYPNSTLFGISFNITDTSYKYEVWYNASLFAGPGLRDFFAPPLLYLERTLEEAIFNLSTSQNTSFEITLRPFPILPLSRVPDALSASLGPCVYFIITALPTVVMAMNALVQEKEKQLRRFMMLMGLRRESWYASWFLTFSMLSFLVDIITVALGRAFQFDFFARSNLLAILITFWLHSLAELSLSFFASVWIRHTRSAVLFATFWCPLEKGNLLMIRYLLGLLFMCVVFSNEFLAFGWWSPDTPAALRWILIFVPFFNVFEN